MGGALCIAGPGHVPSVPSGGRGLDVLVNV